MTREEVRARIRKLAADPEVTEMRIRWPLPVELDVVLLDLRGLAAREAWPRAKDADVCAIDVASSGADEVARELAQEVGAVAPHVWVVSDDSPARVGPGLGLDAGRVVCVPDLRDGSVGNRLLDERALTAAVRTIAALRLAQRGIDDAIAQDGSRDEEVLKRLGSYALPEGGRRRDETRKRVLGATAGRAIRILQGALIALDAELAAIREQRLAAVAAAKSLDELRLEVAAAGPPLAELPSKLAAHAQSMVLEALSQLGPGLMDDLDRRVDSVVEDVGDSAARPVWPPPQHRVALAEDALVARESLAQGEDIHAEIGWTDSVLRSLEKVKQRVAQQLGQDLDRIAQRARAEVMRAEPLVARSLHGELEAWVAAAGDVYTTWLDERVAAERAARAAARERRQSAWVKHRDALHGHALQLGILSRALGTRPAARPPPPPR